VRLFELQRDGAPAAYVFLDPFARAAEKRGGAWMDEVCSRSRAFASAGSAVRLPVAHMVCNQSPPVTEADGSVTPSLMTFREVTGDMGRYGEIWGDMMTFREVTLFLECACERRVDGASSPAQR